MTVSASASGAPTRALEVCGRVRARGRADVAALAVGDHEQAGRARVGADVLERAHAVGAERLEERELRLDRRRRTARPRRSIPQQKRSQASAASARPSCASPAARPEAGRRAGRARRRAGFACARPPRRAGRRTSVTLVRVETASRSCAIEVQPSDGLGKRTRAASRRPSGNLRSASYVPAAVAPGGAALHSLLELAARGELRHGRRGDLHLLGGIARVDALPRGALLSRELAESGEDDLVAALEASVIESGTRPRRQPRRAS